MDLCVTLGFKIWSGYHHDECLTKDSSLLREDRWLWAACAGWLGGVVLFLILVLAPRYLTDAYISTDREDHGKFNFLNLLISFTKFEQNFFCSKN